MEPRIELYLYKSNTTGEFIHQNRDGQRVAKSNPSMPRACFSLCKGQVKRELIHRAMMANE